MYIACMYIYCNKTCLLALVCVSSISGGALIFSASFSPYYGMMRGENLSECNNSRTGTNQTANTKRENRSELF